MLGSWFRNPSQESNLFDEPPPPIEVPPGPVRSLTSKLHTPHDAILADIHGEYVEQAEAAAKSNYFNVPSRHTESLRDPYDGSVVGQVVPADPPFHLDMRIPYYDPKTDELLWSHLSKVLELQSEIAALHLGMEVIGTKQGNQGKGKSRANKDATWEGKEDKEKNDVDDAAEVGEYERVDVSPEADEEKQNRERAAEFAKLSHQFEGRKEGILEVMNKLDDLSKALTDFHALQEPKIDFPLPRNSASSSGTSSSSMDKERITPTTSLSTIVPPSTPTRAIPRDSNLIVNPLEPGSQSHFIDNPDSLSEHNFGS
ncbi:uncharacterized protein BT62DRAFT_926517 [Guyanagaster necrorhizus]|uniref:Uncharacterized protein n=1 Tax=Guyanagaster necrorhizus TaxID=856835 RepID=A0A9P7W4J1_9AGAR|nr:uncharacterized protein BT62DRAFT_926517 [Guyanagaster necrorhizus MCA 3950]KAG7452305.1 hypothetical protein BT62DRAFT_926517 [Guyanagaster necrorhizus MCA 3950]